MWRTLAAVWLGCCAALAFAGAPSLGSPSYPSPDLLYFRDRVLFELDTRCAGCHSDPTLAGGFVLKPIEFPAHPREAVVLANFRSALAYLDPRNPEKSPLLRKALGESSHGGGTLYRSATAPDFDRLLSFALGATLDNRPPDAIVQRTYDAKVGERLDLDGTLSADRDGQPVTFAWRVSARPEGSEARIRGETSSVAAFAPDLPGRYLVTLTVSDGALESSPAKSQIYVSSRIPSGRAGEPPPLPLDHVDAARVRLLRRTYYDLLWRGPTLPEIRASLGRPHAEIVHALLATKEAWNTFYEQQLFYFLLLNRFRPTGDRIADLPDRLARKEVDVCRALREIVGSQYFNARNPGNDTFVTVVLEQCLGLVVQERANRPLLAAGKRMYDGYPTKLFGETGRSQADFVRIVCSRPGFYEHFLQRTYERLCGAEIPGPRLKKDAARLAADEGSFPAIVAGWLCSPAYVAGAQTARTKPEVPYVRGLFLDVLGRLPTYVELRNVRNAFLSLADPTPLRLVVARVLLDSAEARKPEAASPPESFVSSQFLRLLGRLPSRRERSAFANALREKKEVTRRVVVWTLLSSPEYQTY